MGTLAERFRDEDNDWVADVPPEDQQIDPSTLGFSPIAHSGAEQEEHLWKEFMAHLSKVTGKEVTYVPSFSSTQQFDKFGGGSIIVMGVNTGAVPAAVFPNGFVPVAAMADSQGKYGYNVEILVSATSTIQKPEDIRGKTITLTNFRSNAGYKAPLVLLLKDYKLIPEVDFGIRFSASYESAVEELVKGNVDVISIPSDLLTMFQSQGKLPEESYRVIARSDRFAPACYGYRYDLKPELAEKVREAFMSFSFEGTGLEKEFSKTGLVKFVPVHFKNDYEYVRQVDAHMSHLDSLSSR
jgi:phosphonate transport system substrate-binding protein